MISLRESRVLFLSGNAFVSRVEHGLFYKQFVYGLRWILRYSAPILSGNVQLIELFFVSAHEFAQVIRRWSIPGVFDFEAVVDVPHLSIVADLDELL